MKLNLGAGNDILEGYINHDISNLTGIDTVHDLNDYPWPWENSCCDEIIANDVIEHLDNFMFFMEEAHRILVNNGVLKISVPYWNSVSAHADPTHKRGFHELTFRFFDPESYLCKERHYYTNARFNIVNESFIISPFAPYFQIPGLKLIEVNRKISKRILGLLGNLFSNIILDLRLELKSIK